MRRSTPSSRAPARATHSASRDARAVSLPSAHSMRSFEGAARDASIDGALDEDDPRTKFTVESPVMARRSSSESVETLY